MNPAELECLLTHLQKIASRYRRFVPYHGETFQPVASFTHRKRISTYIRKDMLIELLNVLFNISAVMGGIFPDPVFKGIPDRHWL